MRLIARTIAVLVECVVVYFACMPWFSVFPQKVSLVALIFVPIGAAAAGERLLRGAALHRITALQGMTPVQSLIVVTAAMIDTAIGCDNLWWFSALGGSGELAFGAVTAVVASLSIVRPMPPRVRSYVVQALACMPLFLLGKFASYELFRRHLQLMWMFPSVHGAFMLFGLIAVRRAFGNRHPKNSPRLVQLFGSFERIHRLVAVFAVSNIVFGGLHLPFGLNAAASSLLPMLVDACFVEIGERRRARRSASVIARTPRLNEPRI